MTNRQLAILAVVAAGMVAVTVLLHLDFGSAGAFASGQTVIQGLDAESIHGVAITKGADSVTLSRTGDVFTVDEKSGRRRPSIHTTPTATRAPAKAATVWVDRPATTSDSPSLLASATPKAAPLATPRV